MREAGGAGGAFLSVSFSKAHLCPSPGLPLMPCLKDLASKKILGDQLASVIFQKWVDKNQLKKENIRVYCL